jgi:GTP-binding protein HflX
MGFVETIEDKTLDKAILIAVTPKNQSETKTLEYIDELSFLAQTAGIQTLRYYIQKLEHPDPRTYIGKGKLSEITHAIERLGANTLIFDDELTPSQLRNLENELKIKIYDRSLLILDIFLMRAKTAQAKTQVQLARYQYLLPRLTRMWTHLERQRGGTGTRGGAGEKELETDKRMIKNQIAILKSKLKKIELQSQTRRKGREGMVRVVLVGYTNVGKSTLMRELSKENVIAEDKLFATVDSTVRKVILNNIPFLLTDTVGFIRKLPHTLIESFKSTLDEVREADILIHVADISHPSFEEQIEVVNKTLEEIDALNKPTLLVLNKVDKMCFADIEHLSTEDKIKLLNKSHLAQLAEHVVFASIFNKINLLEIKDRLAKLVYQKFLQLYPNSLFKKMI